LLVADQQSLSDIIINGRARMLLCETAGLPDNFCPMEYKRIAQNINPPDRSLSHG